jgi:hypothetical protein
MMTERPWTVGGAIAAAVILSALGLFNASAASLEPIREVLGLLDMDMDMGGRTCGEFAADYQRYPERTEAVYLAWAQGFMSGINSILHRRGPGYKLEAKSVEEQQAHLRAYCDQHPLRQYLTAVSDLLFSLPETSDIRYMGVGAHTCGEFAADYKRHPEATEEVYSFWAQGLMSGINFSLGSLGQPQYKFGVKSTKERQAHIRWYCEQHPLGEYIDAVLDLFSSSPKTPAPPKAP